MNKMSHSRVVIWMATMGLLGGALLAGGCASEELSADVYLPDQPRLVGGGILIEWRSPEPGTAYLVEQQTGKVVETRSLGTGDVYSFAATSVVQADEFEQMLGIPFGKAQFLLYFEPLGAGGSATVTSKPLRTWRRS